MKSKTQQMIINSTPVEVPVDLTLSQLMRIADALGAPLTVTFKKIKAKKRIKK